MRKLHGRDEPVKIYDTYQMLGLVDEKDAEMFGIDVLGIWSDMTVFGYRNQEWMALENTRRHSRVDWKRLRDFSAGE